MFTLVNFVHVSNTFSLIILNAERFTRCGRMFGFITQNGASHSFELPICQHVQFARYSIGGWHIQLVWIDPTAMDGISCNGCQFSVGGVLIAATEIIQKANAGLTTNARIFARS